MKKKEKYTLSIKEIQERLRTDDSEIIDDIYNMTLTLLESEEKRMNVIDMKGNYIIGIAGVALSLIFTLGSYLYSHIFSFSTLLILYLITFGLFSISLIIALFVIAPKSNYKAVNEKNLFNKEKINKGQNVYRRFITAHIWTIFQHNFSINEKKGQCLKWAYGLLVMSVVSFIPLVLVIASQ